MGILDHINLYVSDFPRSKAFYEKALAPLGITLIMEFGEAAGFGRGKKAALWVCTGPSSFQRKEHLALITPMHVALAAEDRGQVDGFHAAAIAAGATDFGPPGVREVYHPNYYGAFVLDPDGHDIEAVFHG